MTEKTRRGRVGAPFATRKEAIVPRRHWPIGLRRRLKKLGYVISKRPILGVARALSNWAAWPDGNPKEIVYCWRIEKRDSELHKTAKRPLKSA